MPIMCRVIGILAIALAVVELANSIEFTPTITIDSGQLRGHIAEVNNTGGLKIRRYLGISFAQAERFQPPKPPKKWNGVKSVNSLGKSCPQMLGVLGVSKLDDISEDCLNLNVFVPDDVGNSSSLPVMVWIHGGGFSIGSNRAYDGSYISVLGKVVVVAINYRVSVFGFLTNGIEGDIKGNYGMLDQVEALKWVKRNIAKFNGDPNKVTIFGESAGGASVSLLMLSKLAKGLFHRAIAQSGDAAAFWASASHSILSKSVKEFAKYVGCPDDLKNLRECLKPKDAMTIINASLRITQSPRFVPVIDKYFLDDDPRVLYKKQEFEKVDVMMGVTNDEGTVFTNAVGEFGMGLNVTYGVSRDTFLSVLKGGGLAMMIPDPKSVLINATIYRYTDWTDVPSPIRNRRMYVDLLGDMAFVSPAMIGAKAYSMKKLKTFFYSFEHRLGMTPTDVPIPSWVKAFHGADVIFVFGFPILNAALTTEANFTRNIIKLWTNFAKTGNPNSPVGVGVTWPEYTLEQQKYISLKPHMVVESHLRADYMAYWNWFVPSTLHAGSISKPSNPANHPKATDTVIILLSIVTTRFFLKP